MEVSDQYHALTALFPGMKPTTYCLGVGIGSRVVVDWFGEEVFGYFYLD